MMEAPNKIWYTKGAYPCATDVEKDKTPHDTAYIRADLVDKLIDAYQSYEKLFIEEIESMIGIAHAHGWKSTKHEAGEVARRALSDLIKEVRG